MPAYISSDKFMYDSDRRLFTADISELNLRVGQKLGSFYIKSRRTGAVRLFLLSEIVRDPEGDVVMIHYVSPGQGLKATVFND